MKVLITSIDQNRKFVSDLSNIMNLCILDSTDVYCSLDFTGNRQLLQYDIENSIKWYLGVYKETKKQDVINASVNLANYFYEFILEEKPDIAVVYNGYADLYRATLWNVLKALGIKSIRQEIGILKDYFYLDVGLQSESFACKKSTICHIESSDRYYKLGNFLKNKYIENKTSRFFQDGFMEEIDIRIKYNIPDNYKICFVPMQVPGDSQFLLFSDWIKSPLDFFDAIQESIPDNYFALIKKHPAKLEENEKQFVEMKKRNKKSNISFIGNNENIHSLINAADIVCTVNSGVGFESLMYNKPVICAGGSIYDNYVIRVNNINELKMAFNGNIFARNIDSFLGFLVQEYMVMNNIFDFKKRIEYWYDKLFQLDN